MASDLDETCFDASLRFVKHSPSLFGIPALSKRHGQRRQNFRVVRVQLHSLPQNDNSVFGGLICQRRPVFDMEFGISWVEPNRFSVLF